MSFLRRLMGGGSDPAADAVRRGYEALVAQARHPHLYETASVPDSKEGRYDMLVLHAFLLFHRLADEGDEAEGYGQKIFDFMIRDLEGNLRSIGISDLAVPRHVKQLARSFYGRVKAYRSALEADDPAELRDVLARNVLGVDKVEDADPVHLDLLGDYVGHQISALAKAPVADLLAGNGGFAAP